ncbi:MAG: phenylalanine--tRNA ligase subunit alpha [Dehalococcoidia bacterium]|nr:phenylalanine--tRNA ligase subunit alpha [Dehalococcoidia bacterium]MDZ4246360.1 phenylalanine--tRNA ligase subunit alpha [Dehalococcoidia bacterium]
MDIKKDLEELKNRALEQLKDVDDDQGLEKWRVFYLGKKSPLNQVLRGLASLPIEERRLVGAMSNDLKLLFESNVEQKRLSLYSSAVTTLQEKGRLDVTLPGRPVAQGRLHPTTRIVRQICDIFSAMGFQVVEGPEVETDYYNFEALNIPKDHPARDMWDTFWIDRKDENGERTTLLRTHTSPMQIRVMEKTTPPIRVVVPGKVYRYEATDATHESMFYQVEGLAVDKGVTFGDLKGCLYEFARRLFGPERKARFRCDYFPFVEPGVEMAIDCFVCAGKGCRLCSNTGWIEILGAGMVHPDVLRHVNYDPDVYTGFAFGMGVERIPILRYGIEDIRLFYGNDLRFLRQF